MRTVLFRTDPVLVDTDDVVVALKDLDGATPVTLYLENMDIRASLTMIRGSKDANLKFTARDAGAAGNGISVEFTAAAGQAFSISVLYQAITVALQCGADGLPTLLASDVMTRMQADAETAALVRVALAPGSAGLAVFQPMVQTSLAGGFASQPISDVTVEHSPEGWPDFDGPWDESLPASATFTDLPANTVKAFDLDVPVKGLRITVDVDIDPTYVVASAMVQKKRV